MKDLFEDKNKNFFATAFIPAAAFLLAFLTFFYPVFPSSLGLSLSLNFSDLALSTLLLITLAIIIGLTLNSLNTIIFKIFEGDLDRFHIFRKFELKKARKLRKEIEELDSKLQNPEADQSLEQEFDQIQARIYQLKAKYISTFPDKDKDVLPTRFGNILRAAAEHIGQTYGIDTLVMWPRQVMAVPESYYQKLMETQNSLTFLVNCSILSIFLAGMCVFASAYECANYRFSVTQAEKLQVTNVNSSTEVTTLITLQLQSTNASLSSTVPISTTSLIITDSTPAMVNLLYFLPVDISAQGQIEHRQRSILYGFLFFVLILISYFFYIASLPVARRYGDMMCIAFDLFRFDLLRQFRIELPIDSDYEYDTWRKLSEFVALGYKAGPLSPFEYIHGTDSIVQPTENRP